MVIIVIGSNFDIATFRIYLESAGVGSNCGTVGVEVGNYGTLVVEVESNFDTSGIEIGTILILLESRQEAILMLLDFLSRKQFFAKLKLVSETIILLCSWSPRLKPFWCCWN